MSAAALLNDRGYTLTEMLAALAIIGLTAGGLAEGVHTIGQHQAFAARAAAESQSIRSVQQTLERLFDGQGPFATASGMPLTGTSSSLEFICAGTTTCRATIQPRGSGAQLTVVKRDIVNVVDLPTSVSQAQFSYGFGAGVSDHWPPTAPGRQVLAWVAVKGETASGVSPLADIRLWTEQPRVCEFDVVAQDCRSLQP